MLMMMRLAAALLAASLALLAQGDTAYAQQAVGFRDSTGIVVPVSCDKYASFSITSATTTLIIPADPLRRVAICAYNLDTSGNNTVTIEYGTGAACGTGTATIIGPYDMTTAQFVHSGTGLGTIARTPAANAVCVVTTTTANAVGIFTYAYI